MNPEFKTEMDRMRTEFEALVGEFRPDLHRYCARMVGSAVDGEDVLQDALAQAFYTLGRATVANMRGWLVRIAHNKAIDFLRKAGKESGEAVAELPDPAETEDPLIRAEVLGFAMSHFLKLTPLQRSCVVLKDVMDYSLAEIAEFLDASVGEVKALLHRGRKRLRELGAGSTIGATADLAPPAQVDPREVELLVRYVDLFNRRDYDALRAMLAEDVRLNLVGRTQRRGTEVKEYFTRYAQITGRLFKTGTVEGRPAVLVYDDASPGRLLYFVLLEWRDGAVTFIRDYAFVPYIGQELSPAPLSV